MKKEILTMILAGALGLSAVACGNSAVSKEEYDKVVQERDEYKAELDAMKEEKKEGEVKKEESNSEEQEKEKPEEDKTEEFKIGETWEVEGKFKVTVNSVTASDYRNEFEESNPAAVYIINYTYENIGVEELFVDMENQIVDNSGKMGASYPGEIEKYAQAVPVGANCEAEACIAVENPGSFKDYVSVIDNDYIEHKAIFNLEVQWFFKTTQCKKRREWRNNHIQRIKI